MVGTRSRIYNTDVLKVSTLKATRRDDNVVKMVRFSAQFVLMLVRNYVR